MAGKERDESEKCYVTPISEQPIRLVHEAMIAPLALREIKKALISQRLFDPTSN